MNNVKPQRGTLNIGSFIVPVGGALTAFVLAVVYAYLTVYSPIVGITTVLFLAGLTGGLGVAIAVLARLAKCRSVTFLLVTGFACAALALYASWVVFEYALIASADDALDWTPLDLARAPGEVFAIAMSISERGWYSVFGFTPSGAVLWLIWAIEAFVILAVPTVIAAHWLEDEVFCERCKEWCTKTEGKRRLALPDDPRALQHLGPDSLGALSGLALAEQGAYPHLRLDMWQCHGCEQTEALQLTLCSCELDDDGKPAEVTNALTPVWVVGRGTVHGIARDRDATTPATGAA